MSGLLQQLAFSLRLHFRNRMALLYGYLFPLVFLTAFWVLYRHESVPLARHMGELLTVTVLGGACFGLPTTMVSERERGVWRRYRLAPMSTGGLVASTVMARYFILITAGLLQLGAALIAGMPLPRHPLDLWLAFSFVSFAFLGLGLVMAMMADNVPAVQALGQCIFLPMLIIGGVAVPLASLPAWALHVSAFFPGRYAVEALQACVTGPGLGGARFNLLALVLIGAAGCLAGAKMFRWDAQQRFATRAGKSWVLAALASWAAVGLLAESRGHVAPRIAPAQPSEVVRSIAAPAPSAPPSSRPAVGFEAPALSAAEKAVPNPPMKVPAAPAARASAKSATPPPRSTRPSEPPTASAPAAADTPATANVPATANAPASAPAVSQSEPTSWRAVTLEHIDRDLIFDRLPSDSGIVTPIAPVLEEPDPDTAEELEYVRQMLPAWQPGKVADPVQRVRNYLYVAAVPDVFQMTLERYVPHVVFDRLQEDIPKDQLIQILYWIALHPGDGDESAVDQLWALHLGNDRPDMGQARERAAVYAVKLLGRLTGKIPATKPSY